MDRLSSKGQMLSQVDLSNLAKSSFDRRNHNYLSGKLGKLIITRLDEVYPGDRIKGNISTVCNFEPMVSPILGSMVLKQEAFYIPSNLLWKNAHKFYTGKNGFNGQKPKVSPVSLFKAYKDNFFVPAITQAILRDISHDLNVKSPSFVSDTFNTLFRGFIDNAWTFADQYGITDLVLPVKEKILSWFGLEDGSFSPNEFSRSKLGILFTDYLNATESSIIQQYKYEIFSALTDILYFQYEYFFGVSSQLDYIGWPVNDKLRDYFFLEHPYVDDSSSFEISVMDVFMYGDAATDRFLPEPASLFSAIALDWTPFRAAYLCWYWNYRDELLETSALDPESDEFIADTVTATEMILLSILRVRCWYKDTFTTALTNTGDGNLSVPIVNDQISDDVEYHFYSNETLLDTKDLESAVQSGATVCCIKAGDLSYKVPMNYLSSSFSNSVLSHTSNSAISLDLFDRIRRLRNFVQKRFILGYEYDDVLWSSFRVKLSNVRMRIPELLTQGRDEVVINTLVNNTTTSEQMAGDKSAVAFAQGGTSGINYFVEEHGFYISYLTVMPIQSYSGGMQRLWTKLDQFDAMWPEFATMGMDAVYNFELSAPRSQYSNYGLSDSAAMQVFGYQGRYYDLKSRQNETHGRLRTDLNYLTFSREFNMKDLPKLNYEFVHCHPRLDMFVTDDPLVDIIRTIDVYSALDFERCLPVPSEMV